MIYPTKIAVVVRNDLASWQKLNVVAFLAGGLVGLEPELSGEPYVDGSGLRYGPLIRQPIMVYAAGDADLSRTLDRCLKRGLVPTIYTRQLFSTSNDADNRAAIAAVPTEALDLVGLALCAERKEADKIIKGLALHG